MVVRVLVLVMMMVLRPGKRRGGNHHNEQGGEQNFPHACIVAPPVAAEIYNLR
jgi:hypothetical protein